MGSGIYFNFVPRSFRSRFRPPMLRRPVTDFGCGRGGFGSHGFVGVMVVLGFRMQGFSLCTSSGPDSISTADCATVFRQLEAVSGESRFNREIANEKTIIPIPTHCCASRC